MNQILNKINPSNLLIFILVTLFVLSKLVPKKQNAPQYLTPNQKRCHDRSAKKCRIPTIPSEESYKTELNNCSYRMRPPNYNTGDLGNYTQCTNNNLDAPNNLPCVTNNRTFDMCPAPYKISNSCYAENYNECMDF